MKYPKAILLQSSGQCNLNCSVCYSRHYRHEYGVMGSDTWTAILKSLQTHDYNGIVSFSLLGEPLTDPFLLERVKAIYQTTDAKATIHTNGKALDGMMIMGLWKAGVKEISISMLGGYSKYESITGMNRGVLIKRIENLASFGFTVYLYAPADNDERIPIMELFSKSAQANIIPIHWPIDYHDSSSIQMIMAPGHGGIDMLVPYEGQNCTALDYLYIAYNGAAFKCPIDWELSSTYGNVKERDMFELFRSLEEERTWRDGWSMCKQPIC